MYKNLKISTVEFLENENYHVYRRTTFFQMDPSARKLQELGNKQNKIKEINRTLKLCTLATNNFDIKLTCH